MAIPLDLTFRDMEPSDAVTAVIRERLGRLEKAHARIHRCVAVVEHPHHSQRHGQSFHVRLELSVPEHVIAVSHDPELDPTHTNVYAAIDDAFRAARRQLQDHARIRRGDVKSHV